MFAARFLPWAVTVLLNRAGRRIAAPGRFELPVWSFRSHRLGWARRR